jgi:hypothetical protein
MRFRAILLLLLCASIACTKSKPPPTPPPKPTGTDTIIYIGGLSTATEPNGIGVVWKNDTIIPGEDSGAVISLSLNGTDLYALSAVYTKNGVRQPVQNLLTGGKILATGTDVYITGNLIGVNPLYPLYWKNGQVINLTATHSPIGYQGGASGITSSGSDVYMCGYVMADMQSESQAVYWKNDSIHYIPNGFNAHDIVVSGDSVFVSGQAGPQVAYWVNDSVHLVSLYDILTGIAVSGGDVYVCGFNFRIPQNDIFYLKNGQKTALPNGVVVSGIAVLGTDVYCVGGDQAGNAVYWKNGVMHILGPGEANCIVIK